MAQVPARKAKTVSARRLLLSLMLIEPLRNQALERPHGLAIGLSHPERLDVQAGRIVKSAPADGDRVENAGKGLFHFGRDGVGLVQESGEKLVGQLAEGEQHGRAEGRHFLGQVAAAIREIRLESRREVAPGPRA